MGILLRIWATEVMKAVYKYIFIKQKILRRMRKFKFKFITQPWYHSRSEWYDIERYTKGLLETGSQKQGVRNKETKTGGCQPRVGEADNLQVKL